MKTILVLWAVTLVALIGSVAALVQERSRDVVRITLTDGQVYGYELGHTANSLQRLTGMEATVTPIGRNHWRFQLEAKR